MMANDTKMMRMKRKILISEETYSNHAKALLGMVKMSSEMTMKSVTVLWLVLCANRGEDSNLRPAASGKAVPLVQNPTRILKNDASAATIAVQPSR